MKVNREPIEKLSDELFKVLLKVNETPAQMRERLEKVPIKFKYLVFIDTVGNRDLDEVASEKLREKIRIGKKELVVYMKSVRYSIEAKLLIPADNISKDFSLYRHTGGVELKQLSDVVVLGMVSEKVKNINNWLQVIETYFSFLFVSMDGYENVVDVLYDLDSDIVFVQFALIKIVYKIGRELGEFKKFSETITSRVSEALSIVFSDFEDIFNGGNS